MGIILQNHLAGLVVPLQVDVDLAGHFTPAHPVRLINLHGVDGVQQPGTHTAMPVDDMNVFDALTDRLPGEGEGVPVEAREPAERADDPVVHVRLDCFLQRQDLRLFRFPANSCHCYLLFSAMINPLE
jgi:hypothetical protein